MIYEKADEQLYERVKNHSHLIQVPVNRKRNVFLTIAWFKNDH